MTKRYQDRRVCAPKDQGRASACESRTCRREAGRRGRGWQPTYASDTFRCPRGSSPSRSCASAIGHDRAGHPAQIRGDGVSTQPPRDLLSASCRKEGREGGFRTSVNRRCSKMFQMFQSGFQNSKVPNYGEDCPPEWCVFRSGGNLPESLSRLTSFGVLIFHHAYELSAAVEMMVFLPFFLVYLGNYQREMLISYQDSQIFLHPLLNGPNH